MSTDLFTNAKLILLIFLSLAVAGCDRENTTSLFPSQTKTTATAPILNVNVMRVSKVEEAVEISVFFGKLKPNRQSRLRFGRPGRIKELFKQVGQKAQAGEQLASLEQEQLEQQDDIVAPYDCIVASQNVVAGEMVSPQSPVLTVIEELPLLVEANLPLEIAQSLETGTVVWIVIGADSVKAQVKTISPIESSAGSRVVSFEITDPVESANWSFGQTVKIRFLTTTANSGYWIPVSALSRESTGLWSALIVTEATAQNSDAKTPSTSNVRRRMLELIQLEDDWALAQGALADGEFVIVNGSHRVVPGQSVNAEDVTAQFTKPSNGAGE